MLIIAFTAPLALSSIPSSHFALELPKHRTALSTAATQPPQRLTSPSQFAGMESSSGSKPSILEGDDGGSAIGAAAVADESRRLDPDDVESSPPHETRKVARKRRGDSRSKRHRKGDAKRARKERALAQADKCEYYHEQGLRRVRPYIYDFVTHAKERWLGKKVIDVFCAEFGGNPRSYYERAIRCGLLTINGETIDLEYKFKNNDVVCNRTHRHEPPVAGGDIKIVSETPEEIVVDKPCTMPVHPCGSYRFNTLFYILQRQRPDLSLRVCHRLDRLTSGLTIFAKTAERAGVIQTQIGTGRTQKTYLARVSGNFGQHLPPDRRQQGSPLIFEDACSGDLVNMLVSSDGNDIKSTVMDKVESVGELSTSLSSGPGELWWRYEALGRGTTGSDQEKANADTRSNGGETTNGATVDMKDRADAAHSSKDAGQKPGVAIRVNCPIRVLDARDGVYECHPEGKEAQTVFRKISYDNESDTSVLECTPVHGRTHQIRLHLQWVGHPIANDPCYGGELHFGDPDARRKLEENPSLDRWKGTRRAREAAAATAMTEEGQGEEPFPQDTSTREADSANAHDNEATIDHASNISGKGCVNSLEQGSTSASHGKPASQQMNAFVGDEETKRDDEDDEAFVVRICSLCQSGERFTENQLHCKAIWLHALRYKGPDWTFETNTPSWAI